MRTSKWLLGAAFAVGLIAAPLVAQVNSVVQNQVSGNEVWRAAQGPGGPEQFLWINTVRDSMANVAGTISASFVFGASAAQAPISDGGNFLVTAQPSAATITLPPNPVPDGAMVGYCNVTGSAFATNAVTMTANSGQTLNTTVTLTTQPAGTCAYVQWNQANLTWYRVQ